MISAFLEIVMQAGLIMCAAPSNISFACHIMSEQMLLVSFSMVVLWWSITICRQRKCLVTTLLVVLVLIQSAGAVLVIIYDVAFERKNFAGFLKTVEFKLQAVSLWTCMALLAVSMLVAALISTIWCRIPQSDDAEDQAQQQAAKRFRCCLSVTTLICAFCFLMRVVMGICAEHFGRADNSWIDAAMWYILCYWIPTAVPSVCMLILWRPNSNATRKQESAPVYGRDRSTDMSPPTDTRRNTRDYYPLGGGV